MTPPSRNGIYEALLELPKNISWVSQDDNGQPVTRTWRTTINNNSRRFKMWTDVAPEKQPALFQVEPRERLSQTTGMPHLDTFMVKWVVYFRTGQAGGAVPPAAEANNILDALLACLLPSFDPLADFQQQTLGGLVHHCFADGEVFKEPGDLDGQGSIVLPITILVPS